MIFVRKAAARPAENGHSDISESLDDIVSYAVGIGDRGILADVDPLIDTSSEVFGKVTVDLGIYMGYFILSIDERIYFFHGMLPFAY